MDEERRADHGGDDAGRDFAGRDGHAGDDVDAKEIGRAGKGGVGDDPAIVGADIEADDMGDDETDEAEGTSEGDGSGSEHDDDGEELGLEGPCADAEALGNVVTHGEDGDAGGEENAGKERD